MRRKLIAFTGAAAMVFAAGAWAVADEGDRRAGTHGHGWHGKVERVTLRDADGERVGKVWMRQHRSHVRVSASLRSLPAGFHGFHVHTTGICDPADPAGPFMSAGGHYNPDVDHTHGEHAGDMPSLYVSAKGWARLSFTTDAFTLAELRDADGSAVMVHAGRDNFANIPADRYTSLEGPVPDSATLRTGDAGDRYACGVVD